MKCKLMSGWSSFLNELCGKEEEVRLTPKEFMDEYRQLRAQYNETHTTSDFVALHQLFQKYGLSREESMKFSRIAAMERNADTTKGTVIATVSARDLDNLLQEGNFSDAVALIKSSMDNKKLQDLVTLSEDHPSFQGEELIKHFPAFIKSDQYKNSDVLLSTFAIRKNGNNYEVIADKERFQRDMSNPVFLNFYLRDLRRINDYTKTLHDNFEKLTVSSEKEEQSNHIKR